MAQRPPVALKSRQHLLNEAEFLLVALPEAIRSDLPSTKAVRPRLERLARRDRNATWDAPTTVRIQLLDDHTAAIAELDAKEKVVTAKLNALVSEASSTLEELCGLSTRSAAELLVEVGDPRRFTEDGFARFNGTAPLPASSGEGPGEPVRHRLNRGGNRRVNAVLHRMAVTQRRCDPRAQKLFADARRGHTKKEAGSYPRIRERSEELDSPIPAGPLRPPLAEVVPSADMTRRLSSKRKDSAGCRLITLRFPGEVGMRCPTPPCLQHRRRREGTGHVHRRVCVRWGDRTTEQPGGRASEFRSANGARRCPEAPTSGRCHGTVSSRLDGRGGRLSDGLAQASARAPLAVLDADKVDASGEAYQYLQTPDATLGLASYAATLVLAGMGSDRRAQERPWIPLALAAKVGLDAVSALYLTVEQGSKHRRFCSWCLVAAGLSAAMVPQVVPEARTAWGHLRSRTS